MIERSALNTRNLNPKERVKLSNQSLVFEAIGENEKLTIPELVVRLNIDAPPEKRISERTIRRAVEDLVRSGHLRAYGKSNNAMTYGKLSASMTADGNEPLVPFNGTIETVENFLRVMTSFEERPFTLKVPILSEEIQHTIRRLMVWTILTSGEPGHDEELKKTSRRLYNVIAELEFALSNVKAFVESPIWYPQYRDRMGYAVRRVLEKDPELFKLASEYVKNK